MHMQTVNLIQLSLQSAIHIKHIPYFLFFDVECHCFAQYSCNQQFSTHYLIVFSTHRYETNILPIGEPYETWMHQIWPCICVGHILDVIHARCIPNTCQT